MSRSLGLAIALVTLSVVTAPAAVVLNTLTSELDGTVTMTAANDRRYAQSFTTSASGGVVNLSEVSIDLSATGTTSLDIGIFSNSGGSPGSRIEWIARPRNITLASPYVISNIENMVFVDGPLLLAPATTYWLYVQRVGGADVSWGFTDDQGVANGWRTVESPWTITSTTALRTGVAVVPEPSTYVMALAGLACGGYLVRRCRRRG